MKLLQIKKSLYYLCALIVLLGYQILSAVLYNRIGIENLLNESHYFLFMLYSLLRWGISGVLVGLFLQLILERKKNGVWRFNWPRFIFFTGGLILLIVFEQLYHVTAVFDFFFYPVHYYLFGDASFQAFLLFLLGFSLMTCFCKKTLLEPVKAVSRMMFPKIKKALYYLFALIVLLCYLSLWSRFYLSKDFQTGLLDNKNAWTLVYLVYPLLDSGVSGLWVGLFLYLIPEMKRSGTWRFNWQRFIFYSFGLILILASDQIYYYVNFPIPFHQLLFYGVSIKGLLMLLLGYSLLSCLYKKARPEPVELKAEVKTENG